MASQIKLRGVETSKIGSYCVIYRAVRTAAIDDSSNGTCDRRMAVDDSDKMLAVLYLFSVHN